MPSATTTEGTRVQFATLAAVTVLTGIVSSLGAPLVPTVAREQDVSLATAQWMLTATLLAGAVVTPVLGRLATGRLRRPVLLAGLVAVLCGALLTALPLGIGTMIAGRTLQGVGMALAPLAFAVARDLWSGQELLAKLAALSVASVSSAGLGYPASALVAEHFGIGGAYVFGSILIGATTLLAFRHLPASRDGEPQPIDVVGALLLCTGTLGFLLAVSQGERWGWAELPTLATGLGGVVLLVAWIRWSIIAPRRGRPVLVDLHLAVRPGVRAPNLVTVAVGVSLYGLFTLVVVLVQADGSHGFGLHAGLAASGLVLVPYAIAGIVSNRIALLAARRIGTRPLLPAGCLVFGTALVMLTCWHDTLGQALLAMAVGGLGGGLTFSSMAILIVPNVDTAETGSAMAFNQLLRYLGFSVGSALAVALLQVYGGDAAAFRATGLTMAAICVVAGALASLDRGATARAT
ncbi:MULTISPECIES: MFS transporter [unclassified Nocardioides]|uniref:MFS transporter n=1 Tax=unclassified Nocardioides TaxID=2615069 RepID=UPI00114EFF55|nr:MULTISPECIES: MFS transporter [unclassified Nocardioides]TQK69167.1 putative MFS family arabinose efflux permease [Nocardioides sp. SLBN-35]WGY01527.1 MFS transporter [Nocardioides sp. QY071]